MFRQYWRIMALVLFPVGVNAATVLGLEEPQLVQRSDAIVFGSVLATEVKVDPRYGIYTEANIQVYDGLLGAKPGEVLKVKIPGGKLPDGRRAVVSGAPTLTVGERFFAFLEKRNGSYVPWGLSFGWLQVRKSDDGQWGVSRILDGLNALDVRGNAMSPKQIRLQNIPLSELSARIRGHLAALEKQTDFEQGGVR